MMRLFFYNSNYDTKDSQCYEREKQKGFSLVELLVVISIIGVLIAISAVAYSTAQQKSRDAKRRADLKAIQSGFEQFYAQNSSSYDTCDIMFNSESFPNRKAPVDPKGGSYGCVSTATQYCICALLETGGGNASQNPNADGSCNYATGSYYCMSNLQ